MLSPDFIGAVVWLAAGLFLVYEGRELGLGTLIEPGSGFILFWIGFGMAGLSLALAATALAGGDRSTVAALWRGARGRKVVLVLLYLLVYAVVLEPVGFILATAVLLVLLFKTVEPQSWTTAIVGAVATTAIVYIVFGLGLGTQFPNGLFGFR
jgi:putative tricarboxylic transport membrane protein